MKIQLHDLAEGQILGVGILVQTMMKKQKLQMKVMRKNGHKDEDDIDA